MLHGTNKGPTPVPARPGALPPRYGGGGSGSRPARRAHSVLRSLRRKSGGNRAVRGCHEGGGVHAGGNQGDRQFVRGKPADDRWDVSLPHLAGESRTLLARGTRCLSYGSLTQP